MKIERGTIFTASGGGCRNEDRSLSSIAPGTAAFWWSAWKDSPREAEWKRGYKEINSFERQLRDFGAIVAKFWIHISREEQLRRFEERKAIGYKAWKLTDEDWRNREKWETYEEAVEEMLVKTSTATAPWTLVEGNDKYWARTKVLAKMVEILSTELNYQPADPLRKTKGTKTRRKT